MKTIGLLSDTHGTWDERFGTYFSLCDEIWHAGDIGSIELVEKFEALKPFRAVYGNIDDARIRREFPHTQLFDCEGVSVMMTHIGGYPGKYPPALLSIFNKKAPQLFICGHSHILKVMYDRKYEMLCVNPGAAGAYGFHKVRTLMRLTLDAGMIKDAEVIELGDKKY